MKIAGIEKNIWTHIIGSFFRTALIEEAFKFLGFRLGYHRYKVERNMQTMLLGGMISLMYEIVEKVVPLNLVTLIKETTNEK